MRSSSRSCLGSDHGKSVPGNVTVTHGSVEQAAGQYAIASAIFSFGGLSFALGERMLERARKLIDPDDVTDRGVYQSLQYLHCCVSGDLDRAEEMDDELYTRCIRQGLFWHLTNYLCFATEKHVYQGRFAQGHEFIERLDRMADQYGYDFARTTFQGMRVFLTRELRDVDACLDVVESYYADNREDQLNIIALSIRAEAHALKGDFAAADRDLADVVRLIAHSAQIPPYYVSIFRRARLHRDVIELESNGAATPDRALLRRAAANARSAQRIAGKLVWHVPEVARLSGLVAHYQGKFPPWTGTDRPAAFVAVAK